MTTIAKWMLLAGVGSTAMAATNPATMPANTWLAVPNTHMRTVAPAYGQFAGTWGISGVGAVINAWGGGALDTKRSQLVLWGGGHGDYYGNELYAFDIPTLTWKRLTDPFVNPVLNQEVQADGTPDSRHTYGGLAYLAHVDRFLGQGGSQAGNGFANCTRTWTFDFVAKQWSDRAPVTTPGGGFGCICAYDPDSKKLWWGSANNSYAGLWSYDYDTNAWTKRNDDHFYDYSCAFDTKRGMLVVIGGGQVFSYDIKGGNFTRSVWTTSGGSALLSGPKMGFDYDPVADRLLAWSGGAVYALDPVAKAWTAYNPPGAPLATGMYRDGPGYQTGIYGRWRYVPSINSFILVTNIDEDVHFYKFTAGGGSTPPPSDTTPPTVALTAPSAGASLSGAVTVSATAADAVGVVGVQFRLDGVALGAEDLSAPYAVAWSTTTATNGAHTLTAVARDAAGNTATSPGIVVTVVNSSAGTAVTSFQLSSATSGTLPFTVGLGLKKGDVAGVPTLDLATAQVVVKSRWNDGSVKHAIASGGAAMTAGVPLTVTVRSGTATAATNLTAADIQAANPTASISLGSYGTVSLASLLATPARTWISGPEAVEAHYRGAVGSDPTLEVWFFVRYHKGGRTFVRAVVENGSLDVSTATKSYLPTVTIGGTLVWNNGGVTLTHHAHTRWTQEGWIGGDPQVTPRLDTAYLGETRLVPNYWKRNPSATALNALYQVYAPNQRGGWTQNMGDTGYQQQIGLLPLWDSLYLTSGADARAYRSVLANAKALNSYAIIWDDSATKLPVRPSDRPDWSLFGSGQGGGNPPAAGGLQWEVAHHGSGGYLAYLITGDYYYLETMEAQAATCYLTAGSGYGRGLGTSRAFLGQTRGEAWSERTVGQLVGIGPSGDAIVDDYRALLQNLGTRWRTLAQTAGMNQLGYIYSYEIGSGAYGTGIVAPWQQHFWIQTVGSISDLEPFADMSTWNGYRDHLYRGIVGILGGSAASEFGHARASTYTMQISDVSTGDATTWYDSWGTVYQKTFGVTNIGGSTMLGTSGGTPDIPNGYWGNLLPAIAYAVDDGATGADAAWARLSSSTNWASFASSGFDDAPIWGIVPRSPSSPPPTDTTPPVISAVAAGNVTAMSATVSWTTNELADSQVQYGTTTADGNSSARNASRVTAHGVALSGLSASTLYRYRVLSRDAAGNLALSGDGTFTTAAAAGDTTPPVISAVAVGRITARSATVTWTTNEPADSQVQYGTTTAYGSSSMLDATLMTLHSVTLSGLSKRTTYYYCVLSRDAAGNLAFHAQDASNIASPDATPTAAASVGLLAFTTMDEDLGGEKGCGFGSGIALLAMASMLVRLRSAPSWRSGVR